MKLEHAGKDMQAHRQNRQVSQGCFQVLEHGLGMRVRVKGWFIAPLYCSGYDAPKSPENLLLGAVFPGLGWLCEAARVLHQQ